MEFNEKLQQLRKQKGLTQEELAQKLYVSRTAISKWESGRGYPNLDSLKNLAQFFSVTVDELLSGDQILTIAEEDRNANRQHMQDLVHGLLDLSVALLLFLPFFGQETNGLVRSVSLLSLTETTRLLKITYLAVVSIIAIGGMLTLSLQNCRKLLWCQNKGKLSLGLNALGALLFILSKQPYPATLLFVFLMIKVFLRIKKL